MAQFLKENALGMPAPLAAGLKSAPARRGLSVKAKTVQSGQTPRAPLKQLSRRALGDISNTQRGLSTPGGSSKQLKASSQRGAKGEKRVKLAPVSCGAKPSTSAHPRCKNHDPLMPDFISGKADLDDEGLIPCPVDVQAVARRAALSVPGPLPPTPKASPEKMRYEKPVNDDFDIDAELALICDDPLLQDDPTSLLLLEFDDGGVQQAQPPLFGGLPSAGSSTMRSWMSAAGDHSHQQQQTSDGSRSGGGAISFGDLPFGEEDDLLAMPLSQLAAMMDEEEDEDDG